MSNKDLLYAASTIWVVIAAVLVMFMQAGFAFLEAGLTRMKNVGHIAAKNVLIFALCSIVYYLVGFGIAFGDGGNGLVGGSGFFPNVEDLMSIGAAPFSWFSEIPGAAGYMFEVVFAGVSLAIVWGAMAERTKLYVYIVFGVLFTLIYSVVSHWIWSPDGWLFSKGMQDFAGSTVVHYQGALAGLAGALLLGPRIGKYGPDGKPNAIPGHNMAYTTLGVIILWFGWFGFNPGSTLGVDFGGARLLRLRRAEHEHRGRGRRARRARHVVAGDQEAGHLDDAERRDRRARRDHRRLRVRRAVGGDRDRLRRRRDRRLRRAVRRAGRDRRPDRRGRRARHVRRLGHAVARLPDAAVAGEEPRDRLGRPLLRRRLPPARRPGARPRRRSARSRSRRSFAILFALKKTLGLRVEPEVESGRPRRPRARHVGLPRVLHPGSGRLRTAGRHLPGSGRRGPAAATVSPAIATPVVPEATLRLG